MITTLLASPVIRLVAAQVAAAASLAPGSKTPCPDLRVVALTGQPAPGTHAGTRFSFFGSAMFDGAPSIGADSTIGFAGILSDGTAGFWLDHGSGPELLALSGTHAPGTGPGVIFSQRVSEITLVTPPFLVPGHAVLQDTLSGPGVGFENDEGIWHSSGSGLALVTREGTPAPGLQDVRLSRLSLRAIDDTGRSILSSFLAGAVVAGNDESIWRASTDTSLELLAREGSTAPGTGFGVVFAASAGPFAFPFVIGNANGDLFFEGDLDGPGTDSGNDEALFLHDARGTRLFLREGDPVPGMPGFFFRSGSTSGFHPSGLSFRDDDHVAIATTVDDGTTTASALLSDAAGFLVPLVRSGDAAPGTGGRFDLLGTPAMNAHGHVAFLASLAPGAFHPRFGLWTSSAGRLRAVALPDRQVPGQPVGTIFQDIRSLLGFNDAGFVLFSAEIGASGGVSSTALLLANPSGEICVLARTGGRLAISSSDLRTVSRISVRRDALGDDCSAAFAAQFTDGSGAELRTVRFRPVVRRLVRPSRTHRPRSALSSRHPESSE